MINNKEFLSIKKRFENYDAEREVSIKNSRVILKLSKEIIYGLHRGDDVNKKLKTIIQKIKNLQKIKMSYEGHFKVAMQEYVEALAFHKFLSTGKLITLKETNVSDREYLLGIMDVSGEIFRYAMNSSIKGDYSIPQDCLSFLDNLYGILLGFNFRNSELRRKFDSVKYDLQKLEKLVFDLKIIKN